MRELHAVNGKHFQYAIVTIYSKENVIIHFEYYPSNDIKIVRDYLLSQINLEGDCDYKFEDMVNYEETSNEVSFSLDSFGIILRKVD